MRVSVCVCVCARARACVCVCVCVCIIYIYIYTGSKSHAANSKRACERAMRAAHRVAFAENQAFFLVSFAPIVGLFCPNSRSLLPQPSLWSSRHCPLSARSSLSPRYVSRALLHNLSSNAGLNCGVGARARQVAVTTGSYPVAKTHYDGSYPVAKTHYDTQRHNGHLLGVKKGLSR